MAQGARRGGKPTPRQTGAKKPGGKNPGTKGAGGKKPATTKKPATRASTPPSPTPAGPFRLGTIPGATPGRWIDTWQQRMPRNPLALVSLEVADQRGAFDARAVDAALVRLPIERDDLHVISLYDEIPVVVCAAESHLTAADELSPSDLAGEVLIVARDDVLDARIPGTTAPVFAAPATTGDAIEIVASGVGIVIVPMSLARLHHRKDVTFRPLSDGPVSTVALAWPRDQPQELAEVFVGIVRGRTANSSR